MHALIIAVAGALSWGAATVGSPPVQMPLIIPIPVAAPEKLSAGSQYFSFTPKGMRQYLESVRDTQPTLWTRVDPSLSALEPRVRLSSWFGYGGALLSVGMVTTGIILSAADADPTGGPLVLGLMGGGLVVGIGGFVIWAVMVPKRDDLLEVVNLHNRASPPDPLRVSSVFRGGAAPRFRGLRLTVARF